VSAPSPWGVDLDLDQRGGGVFGGVGQGFGHPVVGGDLDLFGQAPLDRDVELDGNGAAASERVQRRGQPGLDQQHRVDATGQLAQLVQCVGRLGHQGVQLCRQSARIANHPDV
jgi:hypothetical protein